MRSLLPLLIVAFTSSLSWASDPDEVEELLSPDSPSGESTPGKSKTDWKSIFQYRGYFASEAGFFPTTRVSGLSKGSGVVEINASVVVKPISWLSFFGDTTYDGYLPDSTPTWLLNQAGVSTSIGDSWSLSIGRERSFRSPGFFVNPSDFLHPSQNTPGQRPQRGGVWWTRLAYQRAKWSLEALFLPFHSLNSSGIPDNFEAKKMGGGLRAFVTLGKFDLGTSIAYANEKPRLGFFGTGYPFKRFETHVELGLPDGLHFQSLLGVRWEPTDHWSWNNEIYYQGNGLNTSEFDLLLSSGALAKVSAAGGGQTRNLSQTFKPFLRRWYYLTGIQGSNLLDRFNLGFNFVASLEDGGFFGLSRLEWLTSSRSTLSALILALWSTNQAQYAFRPIDSRLALEWRVNF